MTMKYDVIVIGGGLGGLVAAAKLAKEGKSILLLEQHDRPGGCATTFLRRDFIMEVGLHEMDGLHPSDGKTKIFNELGLFEGVEYLPLPEFYRFYNGRTDLVMPHDRAEAKRILRERFPAEHTGIDRYFNRLENARRINVAEKDQPDTTIGDFLDSIISDDELKLVLLGNLGYFHDDPYSLSLRYFSIAENAYFNGRANFIQGGSQQLSNRLVQVIRSFGGRVLLNHKVFSIDVEQGLITGLDFINVMPGEHMPVHARAGEYVINAALPQVAEMMNGPEGSELAAELGGHPVGASLLTVYFGFSSTLHPFGNRNYSTFVFDGSVRKPGDILSNNRGDYLHRGYTFVEYGQVDSRLAPEGKSVGAICCIDYLSDWETLSKEEYRKKKSEVAGIFTDRLDRLYPGSRNVIEHIEVGTPKTVRRYTLNTGGAVYGFAQLPDRPALKSLESFRNMTVASAWGKFGGGFSGAIYSGYMAAVDLLRR